MPTSGKNGASHIRQEDFFAQLALVREHFGLGTSEDLTETQWKQAETDFKQMGLDAAYGKGRQSAPF